MPTGSLINHVLSTTASALPQVGDGATILGWSDRYAGTVIKVTPCTVTVQQDHAARIDDRGRSERQDYTYTPNPDGRVYTFRRTTRGWTAKGTRVRFGRRNAYHDYAF